MRVKPRYVIIFSSLSIFVAALFTSGSQMLWTGQVGKCGNGRMDTGEQCDDGNKNNYDGCSTGCAILSGWVCQKEPSVCKNSCGNGNVDSANGEQCDDGNMKSGDGCTAACKIESGFVCKGIPSRCSCSGTAASCKLTSCGNGTLNGGEQCDDGNTKNGDGCSNGCATEAGFTCRNGSPSICSRDVSGVIEQRNQLRKNLQPIVQCTTGANGRQTCFTVGAR